MQVIYEKNMSTTVVTNVVSYQVGVDILGFPVYHEHLFAEEHITEYSTEKQGKNISKNKNTHKVIPYIFSYIVNNFSNLIIIQFMATKKKSSASRTTRKVTVPVTITVRLAQKPKSVKKSRRK